MDTPTPETPSVADLFALVWNAVADLLGTAATAALVRRATRRATLRCPSLAGVTVESKSFTYGYTLPNHWHAPLSESALSQLRLLLEEFVPLLSDLTGAVVVRRLERLSACAEFGLFEPGEKTP